MSTFSKFTSITLLFTGTMLTGCASILGGTDRQQLTLNSEPQGATVFVNGNEHGVTPFQYTYHPDEGKEIDFELRRSGYASSTLRLRPKRNNAVLFADAMLLHIPYPVDKNNAKLYTLPAKDITLSLYKESPENVPRQALPITGMISDLQARSDIGTVGGKTIVLEMDGPYSDLLQTEYLMGAVAAGLRDTWLDARPAKLGTKKGDEVIGRAKLHLRPRLRAFKADLSLDRASCYGPVALTIDWEFHSALTKDSVLFSIPQTTTFHAHGERPSEITSAAITHAARLLAEEVDLPATMAAHFSAGITMAKGAQVSLSTPGPIVFNSRREMIPALVKAVVTIQTDKGHGSGFLISNDGYMITNEHVVGTQSTVKVKFEQGFTLDAQVVKVNSDFDLALVKVQASDLPALTIGQDANLLLGEELFAIGTPLDASLGQSVSRGVLSGRREIEGRTYLQTDVSINPGNSGGPLIDEEGKVVGVTTLKISGKGLEGLGFGVPISVALEMLNITFGAR